MVVHVPSTHFLLASLTTDGRYEIAVFYVLLHLDSWPSHCTDLIVRTVLDAAKAAHNEIRTLKLVVGDKVVRKRQNFTILLPVLGLNIIKISSLFLRVAQSTDEMSR